MNLNYLKDVVGKTIRFLNKTYKDVITLYLYKLILVLGFFILIHQKFTYEYRINKISLNEINLFALIDWQIFVYALIAIPLLILINVFTVRLMEDQYNTGKNSVKYSLRNAGKYSFVFILYYFIIFLLSVWLVQAFFLEKVASKVILLVLVTAVLLFVVLFFRFLPVKTLATGSFFKSIKESFVFVKANLLSSVVLLLASVGFYVLLDVFITTLELNGAMLFEDAMHLKVFVFILLVVVIAIKAAISYFMYLLDINYILDLKTKTVYKK